MYKPLVLKQLDIISESDKFFFPFDQVPVQKRIRKRPDQQGACQRRTVEQQRREQQRKIKFLNLTYRTSLPCQNTALCRKPPIGAFSAFERMKMGEDPSPPLERV